MTAFIAATGAGDVPTGLDRVQDDLRRRRAALRDDADHERRRDPTRAQVPRGLRMMGRALKGGALQGAPALLPVRRLPDARGAARGRLQRRPAVRRRDAADEPALARTPSSPAPDRRLSRRSTSECCSSSSSFRSACSPRSTWRSTRTRRVGTTSSLEINIQNLAAVPSIVYGILGLAFLVRGIGLGRVLLAGAMILTLLVLPTVIISSREAIRAVPDSIRQGGYALGATQWQVVSRQVLPAAIPGIATGSILALSRAIGETAPLIMIGAVTYISFDPTILGRSPRSRSRSTASCSSRRRSSSSSPRRRSSSCSRFCSC